MMGLLIHLVYQMKLDKGKKGSTGFSAAYPAFFISGYLAVYPVPFAGYLDGRIIRYRFFFERIKEVEVRSEVRIEK